MIAYYMDKDKKELNPDLVDEEARRAVKLFSNDSTKLNSSQLRKFYADVKALERRCEVATDRQAAFAEILPMIKLLKAKSEYAYKRKVVPESFRKWLWDNVDCVNEYKDFKAFLLHFEAVVGFSKD